MHIVIFIDTFDNLDFFSTFDTIRSIQSFILAKDKEIEDKFWLGILGGSIICKIDKILYKTV